MPDAPLPDGGGQLRAYIEVESDGSPSLISLATSPGAAALPPAFAKLSEQGLLRARFKLPPDAPPGAYCLAIRFEPATRTPRLAWLVGAADSASRCLTGPMAPLRELGSAVAN